VILKFMSSPACTDLLQTLHVSAQRK